MSQSTTIETSLDLGQYRQLGSIAYLSDFANIFKAFVGSNFLSIPFAIGQCGLVLGVVGLVTIGVLTTHCCGLVVKCKYYAIEHIHRLQQHPNKQENVKDQGHHNTKGQFRMSPSCLNLFTGYLVSDEAGGPRGQGYGTKRTVRYSAELQKRLTENMQYSDLARMCLGKWGLALSNACIVVTQMGFCINYAIFISNAMFSFFPAYMCSVQLSNDTLLKSSDCQYLVNSSWEPWVSGLINQTGTGSLLADSLHSGIVGADYIAEASSNSTAYPASSTQTVTSSVSSSSSAALNPTHPDSNSPQSLNVLPPASTTPNSTEVLSPAAATTLHNSEPAVWVKTWTNAPNFYLMVLTPTALFILLVLPRKVRFLGLISAAGNLSEVVGMIFIFIPVIAYFRLSDTWQWARIEGLPFFFAAVAGAFEGAGTVLSVESGMDGNRHNFFPYLTGTLTILIVIHITLSILSYLSFGSSIEQILTMNIEAGSWESVAINITLIIGVSFTFPLMALPVVNMAERNLFSNGGLFCKKKTTCEETSTLLSHKHPLKSDGTCFHSQVAAWKRNLIRITLVLIVVCLAILLKDSFAFVAAFIGAVGSISIAFIFPCLFHLRLCWPNLPLSIKIKDLSIIVAGVFFCITGIYTVFTDI